MLQKTLKEAVKRNIISENPIADLKKPKTSQKRDKVRALTTEEEVRLYKVLTTEDVSYSQQMLAIRSFCVVFGIAKGKVRCVF